MPPEELSSAEEAAQIRSADAEEIDETAEEAEETSEEAEETAEEALETAEDAEETAEEAEEKSDEALDLAREANELAHRAVGIAEQTQAAVTEIANLLHDAIVEESLEESEKEEVSNAPSGEEISSESGGSGSDIRGSESENRRRAGYSGRLGGRRRR